jgi:hypothetical protein
MPLPEGQVWGRRPVTPSSEAETRSRGRLALNRDGALREGGRPALERGGVPLEGRPTLERGGFVLRWRRTPRVERSFTRGWLGRLFDGPCARGLVLCACLGCFAFVFTSLSGLPLVV